MKASDFLVNFLILNKIDKVFGYIGGAVAHIYDSISKNPNLEIINGIHEQGSAFAAEGYARVTGKSGVVIATSGPGATNLITTIGSCYFDSIPLLCITGQVNTYEFNYNKISRQIGFQETDIVEIVKPITKYAVMVNKIEDLRYELEKAYYISHFQRKGPVLVDIPMNIQRSEFDFDQAKSFFKTKEYLNMQNYYITSNNLSIKQIKHIASKISKAKSPIVLVGGGVRNSNACEILDFFLKKYNLPVVHSLMGKDAIESGFELNLGLIGSYGNRCANLALANSDVILVLGSRLDTRQTGTDLKLFAKNSEIIQVDIDNNEIAMLPFVPEAERDNYIAYELTLNDGTTTYTYSYNIDMPLPEPAEREGFVFQGWFTEQDGKGTKAEGTFKASDAGTTYYAYWTESEEPETPVIPDYPEYYNIMVEECEGVTVETSTNVVREGTSMTFTIEVAEGYTAENMVVKYKRSMFGYWETATPDEDGAYRIQNIYTDIYIMVEGVAEENLTGIEEVTGAKVYTKDGSIYVQTPKQEQVQIISVSGAIVKNEQQVGLRQYTGLQRGVYIICIGEQRFKVRN